MNTESKTGKVAQPWKPEDGVALLDTEGAARMLGIAAATLNIWRARKRYALKYVLIGGCVRYRPSDVEEFIRSRECDGIGGFPKGVKRRKGGTGRPPKPKPGSVRNAAARR